MKNILLIGMGVLFMACNSTNVSVETEKPESVVQTAPFSRGVNFSKWFEVPAAHAIQFTGFVEQDFMDVKSLGADVIRLPVNMHSMTAGAPDYNLDPLLLKFLDIAVDWAVKHELYIIIDNHSFDPVAPTDTDIDKILIKVWSQLAERYKDYGKYVVYEILNEPHGIPDKRWGEIQGAVIEAIREKDETHAIIVGGTDYNSIGKLFSMPEYTDTNLIYTFHFYDPYLFTHQGASWGEPSLVSLAGVPFPYEKSRMPQTPDFLKKTWVENSIRYYENDADLSNLKKKFDRVVAFSRERNAPVFCGEFGVYMIQSPAKDRVKWYEFTTKELQKRNIAWTSWDYFGGFGIFNIPDRGDFNANLNVDVVRAMGFTAPPQRTIASKPLDSGFMLYDDYPSRDFSMGYWGAGVDFSMYDTNAAEGDYSIRWGNPNQYDIFWIAFDRNGNFSYLAKNGYILEFRARTENRVRFDVRFINYENAATIPWRVRYSIDETILPPDGKWHTIRIPLADMAEHGAWINSTQSWLEPIGKFTWENVKQLDFVSEDGDMKNIHIWFDSIKITN